MNGFVYVNFFSDLDNQRSTRGYVFTRGPMR